MTVTLTPRSTVTGHFFLFSHNTARVTFGKHKSHRVIRLKPLKGLQCASDRIFNHALWPLLTSPALTWVTSSNSHTGATRAPERHTPSNPKPVHMLLLLPGCMWLSHLAPVCSNTPPVGLSWSPRPVLFFQLPQNSIPWQHPTACFDFIFTGEAFLQRKGPWFPFTVQVPSTVIRYPRTMFLKNIKTRWIALWAGVDRALIEPEDNMVLESL